MEKVVALIKARGFGSTLPGKNMYPLNGIPVLSHAIQTLSDTSFIDRVYVWSESEEIRTLTQRMGAVPLERPLSMVHYSSGFHTDHEFNFHSLNQIKDDINAPLEVMVNFNCNYVLFEAESLEKMFHKFMEDHQARTIIALSSVEPWLCFDNGCHGLFPFMNDSNIPEQNYPRIYRKLGISMFKCGLQYASLKKQIFFPVSHKEGIDLHDSSDAVLIEYYLKKKNTTAGKNG